ncbi:S24 family peptidase [Niabella insulamsoli]|uniref:S24 family peptidase n=1 Tax=Niabella insulamsoli TaxID=3144874 RepID=UPI0031FDAE98
MSKISDNLFDFLKKNDISVYKFSQTSGIPESRIRQWKRGKGNPKREDTAIITQILRKHGYKLSLELPQDEDIENVNENSKIVQLNPFLTSRENQGKVPVKYYDVDFAAGNVVFYEDNVEFPAYEMNIPAFSGCVAFNVFGDSMEPLIKNGSVCFGRKKERWFDYLEYGQIYGIIMKNGEDRYLKYIRKSEDQTKFLLKSANPDFDDFEIPKQDIHNIWLIEGWMLKRT